MHDIIKIRGARQHNLKNLNVDIPKNKLVVFTGVSGSGKSSLAFDTIYAEGQRRYVESLSTYARQFLGIMEKPDVDFIEGLSPAISIDQKTTSKNPRSTVGTITEVYDYLRLLYARIGHPHCPVCGREIKSQTLDEIVSSAMKLIENITYSKKVARFMVLSPIVTDKKGEFTQLFDNLKAKGFTQVRVDKQIKELEEEFILIKTNKHTIEAVVDKISFSKKDFKDRIFNNNLKTRLNDSFEQALKLSDGLVTLAEITDKSLEMPKTPKEFTDHLFSEKFSCPLDNINLPEIEPRTFSFNSPHGACLACSGIGKILKIEPGFILSEELSITEGSILPFANMFDHDTWYSRLILKVCFENGIDPKLPIKYLSAEQKNLILYGTGERGYQVDGTNRSGRMTQIYETFTGVIPELERRHAETESDWVRAEIQKYMLERVCPTCQGARLKKEALSITIDKLSISELTSNSIEKSFEIIEGYERKNILSDREKEIGRLIIKEILGRLNFLKSVGLEYLTLDRQAASLSGGEAQRIRLASQIGSGLSGVLYVLDEPTIGLHQKDNNKLIDTLKRLVNLGNTVIVVEHDAEMIKNADHIIDFGPGAGREGGEIVSEGNLTAIKKSKKSLTGKFISGERKIDLINGNPFVQKKMEEFESIESNSFNRSSSSPVRIGKGQVNHESLNILGCSQFNLKNIDVSFPLGKFSVITGVSGSGKSSLLVDTLYRALQQKLNPRYRGPEAYYKNLTGIEKVDKAILIDQSPIGRTPRSNPATYTKLFDHIRDIFASTKDAKIYGYKKGRFSFNVKAGRCETCEGQGQIKIEMQFMSDIWITCDVCHGNRYNANTLEVQFKSKNIAEILKLSVDEAYDFFHTNPQVTKKLETLKNVGLGYIELGQPATTLSGGEAQRVKLATELAKKATGRTVYILDEPTTGLHFADVEKLLRVLKLLVAKGNSVFVIEHNLDIIKNADWVIDLGPNGGEKGGFIVAEGTVSKIKKSPNSYTARFL